MRKLKILAYVAIAAMTSTLLFSEEEPEWEIEEAVDVSAPDQAQSLLTGLSSQEMNEEFIGIEVPEEIEEPLALNTSKPPLSFTAEEVIAVSGDSAIKVDFKQLYFGAPIIYTILLFLSIASMVIWLYNLLLLRYAAQMPESFLSTLRVYLKEKRYDEAFALCESQDNLVFKMVGAAIPLRSHGVDVMMNSMTSEGKRNSSRFWQSISLLNDIAVIAPMLGLLGTVMGMFYAFYDLNRSRESISALFDGLGIAVGTTVGGIFVAILSLILYASLKYRLVKQLTQVEEEAVKVAVCIEIKGN
jgi:biopolymer transport protein ExbB